MITEDSIFRIVQESLENYRDRMITPEYVSKLEFTEKIQSERERIIEYIQKKIKPIQESQEKFTRLLVVTNIISVCSGSLIGVVLKFFLER